MVTISVCSKLGKLISWTKTYVNTARQNTQPLLVASKEAGLGKNTEKSKYTDVSRHQNAGQNHNKKTANKRYENVAKFNAWEQHTQI
jgi:hypothetical protein